ncbi:MAG: hypothetical protein IJ593_11860 [Lachnospiraceae bacterium]|nr:hypothetical protein [Lachnospiraceae bacterium]
MENKLELTFVGKNDEVEDVDVVKKKEEAVLYCEFASKFCKNNNMNEWKYLFIKDNQISNVNIFDYYVNNCIIKI